MDIWASILDSLSFYLTKFNNWHCSSTIDIVKVSGIHIYANEFIWIKYVCTSTINWIDTMVDLHIYKHDTKNSFFPDIMHCIITHQPIQFTQCSMRISMTTYINRMEDGPVIAATFWAFCVSNLYSSLSSFFAFRASLFSSFTAD
jgi:hypothetical protein